MPSKPRSPHTPGLRTPEEDVRSYRDLLATMLDGAWETDAQGVIREISFDGRPDAGGLIGQPLQALAVERDRQRFAKALAKRLAAREPFSDLEFAAARDGVETTFEIAAVPLLDAEGRFSGFRGAIRDVSASHRAHRELEYREKVLAGVTHSAAELVAAPNVSAAMPKALKIIGQVLDADRVLVLENRAEGEGGGVELLYQWQAEGMPAVLTPGLVNNPVLDTPEVAAWLATLRAGETAVASRDTATGLLAQVLELGQAETILFVPILLEGSWWGSLSVDECKAPRVWSSVEIDALKAFAEIVGASIMRERHQRERRRAEEELNWRSQRDALTGLANRKLFHEALQGAMDDVTEGGRRFALHYLDLDHFKDINDTLGHPTGDRLLQAVAERLREATRHSDVVARFGGDEFAILQADAESPEDAAVLARKILETLKTPIVLDRRELHIGVSLGIALYEPDAPTAETMLSHAELALYRAKAEGRQTYRFFTASMDEEARRRVELADELRRGMATGQFFLVYQPQVAMDDGRITGVEALVRWRHPVRGLVAPSDFIPETEANGLIVQLGDWILRAACAQAKAWYDAGIAPPAVSVNMSAVQFRRPVELQQEVAAIVRDAGIPPGLLQLELTETTLMEASKAQNDVLERLHHDGLKISLDDFGTGYSSLDYLHRYPVDQIKIAQVFVSGILDAPGDAAIVKAAISLARELGLRIVAEGVENEAQAKLLSDWGCKEIQGYYFSPPVSAEEFGRMLRAGVVRPGRIPAAAGGP